MGHTRDDSLLFSLEQLERLERERIHDEASAREAAREAERRAFEEAERTARQIELQRIEDDERRRRNEEAQRRAETARHLAMERAAVEGARLEVEARAREEAARTARAHEVALAEIRADSARRTYRFLLGASAAATAVSLGIASLASWQMRTQERLAASRAEVLSREHDQYELAVHELEASRQKLTRLERELRTAQLADPASPAEPASSAPSAAPPMGHGPRARPPKALPVHCTGDGDPLNGCLP